MNGKRKLFKSLRAVAAKGREMGKIDKYIFFQSTTEIECAVRTVFRFFRSLSQFGLQATEVKEHGKNNPKKNISNLSESFPTVYRILASHLIWNGFFFLYFVFKGFSAAH